MALDRPPILVVDDDPNNLDLLQRTLERAGFPVLPARSGEEALARAAEATPALVLLDIMMPGMDGFEVHERLRAEGSTREIPVIFLSAQDDTESKIRCLDAGAVDYVTKPFDRKEVVARVQRHLDQDRRRRDLAEENAALRRAAVAEGEGEDAERQIRAWIEEGEGERLEFKSTIRWHLKAERNDKAIELAWLKSVVAYLNGSGGRILIGVADDGRILGLQKDAFLSDDHLLLHVNGLIKTHVGLEYSPLIRFSLHSLEGKQVLVVSCSPSDAPAFLRNRDEEDFYVRVGPASRRLTTMETVRYLQLHRKD